MPTETQDEEIIDLTGPSPTNSTPEVISLVDSDTNVTPNGKSKERPRKRKKRSRGSGTKSQSRGEREPGEVDDGPSKSRARRSASPKDDLFFVDVAPALVPVSSQYTQTQDKSTVVEEDVLLLPTHVSVVGAVTEILASVEDDDIDEDLIEYLDLDTRTNVTRYFEDDEEEPKHKKTKMCLRCGADGHTKNECTVKICLTCGAHNDHTTQGCPISKTCYHCGMRGHLNAQCPNRYRDPAHMERECRRCGALTHTTNECPTWWRMYEYHTVDERKQILELRKSKEELKLGSGGEGFIGEEPWCYNCGNPGHWGDDCSSEPHNTNFPKEPSAFSEHSISSGPFFDPSEAPKPSSSRRVVREWEKTAANAASRFDDMLAVPMNVGRQGKAKEKERMKKFTQNQDRDDPDDWFSNPRNARARGQPAPPPPDRRSSGQGVGQRNGPAKMSFGTLQGSRKESKRPALLDRMDYERRGAGGRYNDRRSDLYRPGDRDDPSRRRDDDRYEMNRRERREMDRRDRERERPTNRGPVQAGPRYKGGYSR